MISISTEYLSAQDVATAVGVSIRRVYQWIDAGYLKATRFGQRVFVITRSDFNQFLRELPARRAAHGYVPKNLRRSGDE
jgi:excisionase family DNA binding protein